MGADPPHGKSLVNLAAAFLSNEESQATLGKAERDPGEDTLYALGVYGLYQIYLVKARITEERAEDRDSWL